MIVYGEALRPWIESKIGVELPAGSQFLGRTREGEPIAVIGFANYTGDDVETYAAALPGGLSRRLLNAATIYIWQQLGCERCTAKIKISNQASYLLTERIGFRQEGILRRAQNGADILIMGMLKEECRYGYRGAKTTNPN